MQDHRVADQIRAGVSTRVWYNIWSPISDYCVDRVNTPVWAKVFNMRIANLFDVDTLWRFQNDTFDTQQD